MLAVKLCGTPVDHLQLICYSGIYSVVSECRPLIAQTSIMSNTQCLVPKIDQLLPVTGDIPVSNRNIWAMVVGLRAQNKGLTALVILKYSLKSCSKCQRYEWFIVIAFINMPCHCDIRYDNLRFL